MAEPTAVERMNLAKRGYAMPDGSYYIRAGSVGASDLKRAVEAVGRGQEDSHNAIRVHIMKRAKALGMSDECPGDWLPDGSLKHADELDQMVDASLEHFGLLGMRWGHHLPGVEVLGGSGNSDGKPSPFIQRGDHADGKSGDSGSSGKDDKSPAQQANESASFLQALHDHVAQQAGAAKAEAESTPGSDSPNQGTESPKPASNLTSQQASAVNVASQKHLANVAQINNKAKVAQVAHKKATAKLAKHPNKAQAKASVQAASKQHAAHMAHLKQVAAAAHKAHQANIAKLKTKGKAVVASAKAKNGSSQLNAQDKAALKQLSPVQRSALKKLTPEQRAHPDKLTLAQKNNLRLTPAERTSLSHLSPKQKAALAKATAASAKKRHEAALAKKAGITGNKSVAAAKKATATAQAKRAAAQKTAYNRLRLNAQNGTARQGMDDPAGTFIEHHGVKGQKWGVKRAVKSAYGFPTGAPKRKSSTSAVSNAKGVVYAKASKAAGYAIEHPVKSVVAIKGAQLAYAHRHQIVDLGVKTVGTAKIVAHIIKVMNAQRKTPQAQEALALGRAYVQGHVVHEDDSESLEHHGIKGMRWGVRRNSGHPGQIPAHLISADAHKAHEVAKKIHEHGTAAVGNDDLQHLLNRQRLLQQHAQLNPADPSNYRKGVDFVKSLTNDTRTVIDAVNTGQRALKTVQGLSSERPAHRQSRRTRNSPLKVVDVRAA